MGRFKNIESRFGQKFFRPKIFFTKDFFGQRFFLPKIFLHKNDFYTKMLFSAKKIYALPKLFFQTTMIFSAKNCFFPKNVFFGQKLFIQTKMIFSAKNDFFPRLKFRSYAPPWGSYGNFWSLVNQEKMSSLFIYSEY